MFHILNHIFKRKQEIEINDKIEKFLHWRDENNLNMSQKIQKELFIDEEEEIVKSM